MEETGIVAVDDDLLPIIPKFIDISRRDVARMRAALDEGDLETLHRLGHSAKGAGLGYGIEAMGRLALEVETSAREGDVPGAREAVEALGRFVDTLIVVGRNGG